MDLILASKSPRRREILEDLGVKFRILTCDTDEHTDEPDGDRYVREIARRKGEAVYRSLQADGKLNTDTVILACDTVVVSPDGEIMGKPHSRDDARRMLLSFSGKEHLVISGICLITEREIITESETTRVFFDEIDLRELEHYLDTDEPYDKAGAYAIQGYASLWIRGIVGDYFNVVGLPVKHLSDLMKRELGISLI